MVRALVQVFIIICFASSIGWAQANEQPPAGNDAVTGILAVAREHLRKGEACFNSGDFECARREFDRSIDYVIEAGVDLRSDDRLTQGWREIIEKINAYQMSAMQQANGSGWGTQEYEGRPEEEVAAAAVSDEEFDFSAGPLSAQEFQRRFSSLQTAFREKYSREMVLTGADHGEHRRLYGKGSAYDIRVRDLNREQVTFIIAEGRKRGLRIKDFSTWEKVAAHNARTYALGRPLDTLATGVHLHIDRMGIPAGKYNTRSIIQKRQKNTSASQKMN